MPRHPVITRVLTTCLLVVGTVALGQDGFAQSISAEPQRPNRTWEPVQNQPNFGASTALLLTDGAVMVQESDSGRWWRLAPDAFGDYVKGTWSQLASLPSDYAPLYYASAVLSDGRVIIIGGEFNFFIPTDSNRGAVYDPKTNTWAPLVGPSGWTSIGDAQSTVLPDGRFMLANRLTSEIAFLNPKTLTWTVLGTGKADRNDEEGWTLLPDGTVLTVDALNTPRAEKYVPWRGQWVSAGSTIAPLAVSDELGPAVLRPDGTVFATGSTGHNAVYIPPDNPLHPGRWVRAPDFPDIMGQGQLDIADGPASLLPNGNVLAAASPSASNAPTHFFEFDGTDLHQVTAPPHAPNISPYFTRMLLLPTGQVLFTDGSNDVEIYTSSGGPKESWEPTITSCPTKIRPAHTYELWGRQFNGLSQAVAYGDDAQAATNYPLVRLTNRATGHVFYSRTHDHSTMAVATGDDIVSTRFDVPASLEPGSTELVVVANGIASDRDRCIVNGE